MNLSGRSPQEPFPVEDVVHNVICKEIGVVVVVLQLATKWMGVGDSKALEACGTYQL